MGRSYFSNKRRYADRFPELQLIVVTMVCFPSF